MSGIVSTILAILMLGIMIAVHEAGHFWAARLTGIEVREFAIGFGPKILGWTSKKKGTKFAWRIIPLGGYCSFYGQDDLTGEGEADPRAFPKQKVWKRIITVLAGPVMNFVLAFVVLTGLYLTIPKEVYTAGKRYVPTIMEVEAGWPAEQAGLQSGDVIVSVNGADARESFDPTDLGSSVFSLALDSWKEGDEPVRITVMRLEQGEIRQVQIDLSPVWDSGYQKYRIGVSWGAALLAKDENGNSLISEQPRSLSEAIANSWDGCLYAGTTILRALKDMVTTGKGFEQTTGPVGVVTEVSKQVREYGMEQYFWLLCVISINLGIMNLLPIPGLDGSRFLFLVLEGIRRKPIPQRREALVHTVGIVLLLGLMLFFTFRDIINIFH